MSKTLEATCVGGVVKTGASPVPSATVLSEGVGQSEGVLVVDADKAFYMAKTSPDLKTTLEGVMSALDATKAAIDKIATTLTDLGGGMAGSGTAPPPTLPASVAEIQSQGAAIETAKAQLETLKGQLK